MDHMFLFLMLVTSCYETTSQNSGLTRPARRDSPDGPNPHNSRIYSEHFRTNYHTIHQIPTPLMHKVQNSFLLVNLRPSWSSASGVSSNRRCIPCNRNSIAVLFVLNVACWKVLVMIRSSLLQLQCHVSHV